jgi:uncharacterized repeat protein (TIGR01451 family)
MAKRWWWGIPLGMMFILLGGCLGVSQNPSYFPHLLPTGDIIRTHAKPPLWGYFSNFDPHACRVEVRPLESTNPVQTQHLLIATVYDDKGVPRRHRRVEWLLEGVGNIIEVDESGIFGGRGYKVDNKYAVSYTDYGEHRITRGNDNPNDDFVIRPGQSWCVISSAVEGDTHVTVYCPEINDWDRHKVFVTKHWVDAEWVMPPPAVNRVGTEHTFTTNIFKHTDHQPLANYRVRYRILDGPPAVFLPSRTQEATVISDLSGNASATIAQVNPTAGVNRIAIEIIRPPDPLTPSGSGIVIGRGETTKEWQGPQVSLTKTGPMNAAVGAEVPFTITVTNIGKVESREITVQDGISEGLEYVRSQPPAILDGKLLVWTLGGLQAGQAHTVEAVFKSTRVGPVTNCAVATTADGLRAENCATTQITAPQLNVTKTGPQTAVIGVPINYQIAITNPGTGTATNVVLTDQFDPGLEHESKANPVELRIGNLEAGQTVTKTLTLTPRQVGQLVNRVTATADGGLTAKAEHPVTVQMAQLRITKTGPTARYVDRPATWDIRVSNPGEVALSNVVVRDQLPPDLGFVSATEGGQFSQNQVVWNIGALQPREEKLVQVTTNCLRITEKAVNVAIATADPGLQVQAEAAVEIRGLPAFRLEVIDDPGLIEVGGRVKYIIDVTNQGSLPGNQVQITAYVPLEMRVINARGPTTPRIEGNKITFPGIDSVQPKQTVEYIVEAEALKAGDVRFRVELRSQTLGNTPVVEEESTNIYDAGTRPRPPPSSTQPPPSSTQPPPSGTQPSPSGTQPSPSGTQPSPSGTQPPPSGTQPPPAPGRGGPPPAPGPSTSGPGLAPQPPRPSPVIATTGFSATPAPATRTTSPSAGYAIPATSPPPAPTMSSPGPALPPP